MCPNLFSPIKVGDITLSHRVALAPLTRCRADAAHTPTEAAVKYYDQRAREPGTLLITEATFIAAKAGGQKHVPGIWSDEQVSAWKKVTDAVHRHGSHIFLQLWAVGRHAFVEDALAEDPSFEYVSSSPYPWPSPSDPQRTPRALTVPEICEYVELFATAARNAVHRAGFDGVEVHGANGYLIQQFLNDVSNFRQDEYGGSIEARCRFALEVMEAVVDAVGEKKTAIRLSPFEVFDAMEMKDPIPTYTYLVMQLRERFPSLAYLHLIEQASRPTPVRPSDGTKCAFARAIWAPRPFIIAGGFTRETALHVSQIYGDIVALGRLFLSNPDLPRRFRENLPLNKYDRPTFFDYEPHSPEYGYTDYPFYDADLNETEEEGRRGMAVLRPRL